MTNPRKAQKNLRLSPEARRLLTLLSNADGIGESAVIEIMVRKEARERGFLDTFQTSGLTHPPPGQATLRAARGRQ